ncbi:HIT family protein [Luteimonas sp. R10]|uniref:HIT family protein n=1 Tax=Luteimonas sp. R10 TaxID=3108176 RepID=UPI00308DCD36|nr:HIT family protein [Luteimonas sp. R10]
MATECAFCAIARGDAPASIVCENHLAMAILDLRQFHPGHIIVIPRRHLQDVRELDDAIGTALMAMVSRVTRAVSSAFPNQGLSLWHSIGEAAFQEVPHLHIHVHPRLLGDDMLRIYPQRLSSTDRSVLDSHATALQAHLGLQI